MKFNSEQEMLELALTCASFTNFLGQATRYFVLEPKGLFGVPDLVVVDIDDEDFNRIQRSFAFEMKLSNWKRALEQAYRYRSFSEMSFVVLDYWNVRPALVNIDLFRRANIGLLSLDTRGILCRHFEPRMLSPFCGQLRSTLEKMVTSGLMSSCSDFVSYSYAEFDQEGSHSDSLQASANTLGYQILL